MSSYPRLVARNTKMSQCDEDEVMNLQLAILDSLTGLVGEKITPILIDTIQEVVESHLREREIVDPITTDWIRERLENRMKKFFQ